MQRREFIRRSSALAGLALLAPACKSRPPIPGGIIGASAAIGHLIRDNHFETPRNFIDCDVVIAGGGISGLSAARWLRQKAVLNIRLLDLEKKVGGNASCGRNEVSAYPWGAHYIPIPNNGLTDYLRFLEEAGVITGHDEKGLPVYNEYHLCFDPQERLYINGHWQDGLIPGPGLPEKDRTQISRFIAMMDTFRKASGTDGLDAFDIPVDRSSKDRLFTALDELTMDDWLRTNGFDSDWLHTYVNYCTRDDFGTPANAISAWTGIHYFASRKGEGANARHYDVLTWPEGNGWLVEKLSAGITDCLQTNSLVLRCIPGPDHVEVHYYNVETRTVEGIKAKNAILAVPQFVANRILPADPERIRVVENNMQYTPWMVANITIDGNPEERSGAPLSWDNVIFGAASLGYVEATHQQIAQLKEKKVFTYYLPLTDKPPREARTIAQQRTHAEWVGIIVEELRKVHPDIGDHINRIDIMLWGHAMVQPHPGWMHGAVRKALQTNPHPRIHLAHTDLAGISIFEEGFYQGINAAEKVIGTL